MGRVLESKSGGATPKTESIGRVKAAKEAKASQEPVSPAVPQASVVSEGTVQKDPLGLFGKLKQQGMKKNLQLFGQGVAEGAKESGKVVLDVFRALPRAAYTVGLTGGEEILRATGRELTPEQQSIKPQTTAERAVFGDQPINTFRLRNENTKKFLEDVSLDPEYTKKQAKVAAPVLVVGGLIGDLIPGVGGAESKVGKQVAKEATELGIVNILKKATKGKISDDLAKSIAMQTKDLTDEKAINSIIKESLEAAEKAPKSSAFDPEQYVKEMTEKRESARTAGQPGVVGKIKSGAADMKAKFVDFTAPIEDVLDATTKKYDIKLKPSEDIHNQIDRSLRSPTLAGQFAKDNGLVDIIRDVDNLDNLDQYLTARHGLDLTNLGVQTGRDAAKDRALVEAFSEKYEPMAKAVSDYSQKILDYSVETGLIPKETAEALKSRYPNYVPFNRVFNEVEKANEFAGGSKQVASLSSQNVIQAIEGSAREVESPIESLLAKTNTAFKQGEKNVAGKLLASYKDLPGNPFELKELVGSETAPHTISYLDNGVKRTFSTTKEIAAAAKALNVEQLNFFQKLMALPVRIAKLGITGLNPAFALSNVPRDQLTSFFTSDKVAKTSLANPENFFRSLLSAARHDELYDELVRAGAGGTSFDLARSQAPDTVAKIRSNRGAVSKIKYLAKNPSELLRSVEDIIGRTEEATRIQQFRGTKKALLAEGMSEKEATIGAARAARENTVNFARKGEYGNALNSAFLYLNAGIQGSRVLMRTFKKNPAGTSAKVVMGLLLPMAGLTAWNLNDPERKAAYKDIPDYEKENNLVWIPPNPTKDDNGKWNVVKIPLPPGFSSLADIPRRLLEGASDLDPVKFGDIANALMGTVSPVEPNKNSILSTLVPQFVKPTAQGAANYNFFTGLPQVPESMKGLSPQNQVRDNTSGSARAIGKVLNVSPIKVEAWIKETFGGSGEQAQHYIDTVLAATGAFPKDQIGGKGIMDAITSRFSKASGGQTAQDMANDIKKELTDQADNAFQANKNAEKKWNELKSLPKEQAAAQFAELKESNPVLAKNLLEIAKDEKMGLDYTDRLVKQLQVKNGQRAQFIFDKLMALESDEERSKLWMDYKAKKIISDEVAKQISYLIKKDKESK